MWFTGFGHAGWLSSEPLMKAATGKPNEVFTRISLDVSFLFTAGVTGQ
jgi:hypothetical protein